jgi:hypothetical protein
VTRPIHPIPYPPPGSLLSSEAAKWYLEAVRAIPSTLGRDREPMELLETAWSLKARLRLAAALSFVDAELTEEFLRAMPLPSIDALLEKAGAPSDADAPRKALAKLLSITELERRAFPGTVGEAIGMEVTTGDETQVMTEQGWKPKEEGGFLPGWPVKTPDGSKRVDEIAVGDLVMSAPADGSGTPQPKRVVKVHRREGRTARHLAASIGDQVGVSAVVMTADSTQLWVEDRGWTRADEIEGDMRVRLFDGAGEIYRNYPLYRTTRPNVGWIQQGRNFRDTYGSLYDVVKHETVETGQPAYLEPEIHDSNERYLRTTIIDLEVEDFHTCYVNKYWARCA